MKKLLILALALMMALSLAACGGDTPTDSGSGSADLSDSGSIDSGTPAARSVTVDGNKIIDTTSDGTGTTSITEYIYDGGTLSEIVCTMKYIDRGTAKDEYELLMGVNKDLTYAVYSSVELDGDKIIFKMDESHVAPYAGFSQNDLAEMLRAE